MKNVFDEEEPAPNEERKHFVQEVEIKSLKSNIKITEKPVGSTVSEPKEKFFDLDKFGLQQRPKRTREVVNTNLWNRLGKKHLSERDSLDNDLKTLPTQPSNYSEVPVHDFGISLLQGMGLSSIQNFQKNVNIPTPRLKGLGIGAKPPEKFKSKVPDTSWISPGLIVKIASKKFEEYGKKGRISSVQSIDSHVICSINLLSSNAILEDIHENFLETVIPSCGENVLVVRGSKKGKIGVVQRLEEDHSALVLIDQVVHKMTFDDICAYRKIQ